MFIRNLVSDVDKIQALGGTGFDRCVQFIQHRFPNQDVYPLLQQHAEEKLYKLKDMMHFPQTIALAKEKEAELRLLIEQHRCGQRQEYPVGWPGSYWLEQCAARGLTVGDLDRLTAERSANQPEIDLLFLRTQQIKQELVDLSCQGNVKSEVVKAKRERLDAESIAVVNEIRRLEEPFGLARAIAYRFVQKWK